MFRSHRTAALLSSFVFCLATFVAAACGIVSADDASANRWEAEIAKFEALDKQSPPATGGVLFVGSSSIRMWDLEKSFPGQGYLNRGFGGSQIADTTHFADRIVVPYQPRIVVLYAGDNDLAGNKTPEQVAADFRAFVAKVRGALPETRIVYIGIKPSIARWKLVEKVRAANRLIAAATEDDPKSAFVDVDAPMIGDDGLPRRELFREDGLHMTTAGYELWTSLVKSSLGEP